MWNTTICLRRSSPSEFSFNQISYFLSIYLITPPRSIQTSLLDLYTPETDTILFGTNTPMPLKNFGERSSFFFNKYQLLQKANTPLRVMQAISDAFIPLEISPPKNPSIFLLGEFFPCCDSGALSILSFSAHHCL